MMTLKRVYKVAICLLFICLPTHSFAYDYLVDFISENYKETGAQKAGGPKIYHTIQIETEDLGSRVLKLTGDDLDYRIWLRQYLTNAKKLIIKVPEDQNPAFRTSKLFDIDISMVHPISDTNWQTIDPIEIGVPPLPPPYTGKKHILIVDNDPKKRALIEMVVKELKFPVTIAANFYDALNIFTNQPDKFNLVIADGNTYNGISSISLVKNILEAAPDIPVIIGTDYKEEKTRAMLTDFFAGFSRVIIKPLVLKELSKTILQVLEKKV
ncbi:MAG: response regulator [Desulfamplus sp.]|nr:response regulator [Desulfamplus sp.]